MIITLKYAKKNRKCKQDTKHTNTANKSGKFEGGARVTAITVKRTIVTIEIENYKERKKTMSVGCGTDKRLKPSKIIDLYPNEQKKELGASLWANLNRNCLAVWGFFFFSGEYWGYTKSVQSLHLIVLRDHSWWG